MGYEQITIEKQGHVASLILDRPDVRNAMSDRMGDEIAAAVAELNEDPSLRVLLVRGRGKSFAAGGDFDFIAARAKDSAENNRQIMRRYYGKFLSIRQVSVPTIAVIHGAAIGAGLCFALGCDIRLAAEQAKLGLNFVRLGLHPGMGASYLVSRLVGPAKAAELMLSGRTIAAEEALACGLVNQLYADGDALLAAARELADDIAKGAPLAVRRTKASIQRAANLSLDEMLDAEAYAQALDFSTDDLAEGVKAFYEKRRPMFSGK
ncbi:MAG: enoyl-CoA hydratase/isomerase family protein [Deltaproteobacteria bacterium]|nr:enoyl-CoA hydratase/isomerase family protein [Deltaproteobacteria bacterium]